MLKQELLEKLIELIRNDLSQIKLAADNSMAGAIHEESKAEDPHDTRSIEASYLAAGQAKRSQDLQNMHKMLLEWTPRPYQAGATIEIGHAVELTDENGLTQSYFLCPLAGGYKMTANNKSWQTLTAQSPLATLLLGKTVGDTVPFGRPPKDWEITAIY